MDRDLRPSSVYSLFDMYPRGICHGSGCQPAFGCVPWFGPECLLHLHRGRCLRLWQGEPSIPPEPQPSSLLLPYNTNLAQGSFEVCDSEAGLTCKIGKTTQLKGSLAYWQVSYQEALAAIFLEGWIFLILTVTGALAHFPRVNSHSGL